MQNLQLVHVPDIVEEQGALEPFTGDGVQRDWALAIPVEIQTEIIIVVCVVCALAIIDISPKSALFQQTHINYVLQDISLYLAVHNRHT